MSLSRFGMSRFGVSRFGIALLAGLAALVALAACGGPGATPTPPKAVAVTPPEPMACTDGRPLDFGFYAFFRPLSYSANPDPASPGFNQHAGYEADLLTALEAMDGAGLRFNRAPIPEWPDIWLAPAAGDFDMVGGGITILESRTRNAAGDEVIAFTNGHLTNRQSLLVRAEEAELYPNHAALTEAVRVGVLAGTTGEAGVLRLTGLADAAGTLAAGTGINTASGAVTADGTAAYAITAAGATPPLAGRQSLTPPGPGQPQVIYLGDELGEDELLAALRQGEIDAIGRGEIGNLDAAAASGGAFAVTAHDPEIEPGGFALAANATLLRACLNEKIDYLTDNRKIGYGEWRADPEIFLRRAQAYGN